MVMEGRDDWECDNCGWYFNPSTNNKRPEVKSNKMSKVIIFKNEDWADEFNYPIFSIATKEKVEELITKLKNNPFSCGEEELYFGTNEFFEFSSEEIINILESAKPISFEELLVVKKFTPSFLGLDIIKRVEGIYNDS